jgi:hypothetical protein
MTWDVSSTAPTVLLVLNGVEWQAGFVWQEAGSVRQRKLNLSASHMLYVSSCIS